MTVTPAYHDTDYCVASAIAGAKFSGTLYIGGSKQIELDRVPVDAASAGHACMLEMFHPIADTNKVRALLLANEIPGLGHLVSGGTHFGQDLVSPGVASNPDYAMAKFQDSQIDIKQV